MEFEYTTCPLVIALSPVAELVFNVLPVDIGVTKIAVVEDWAMFDLHWAAGALVDFVGAWTKI